MPTADPRRLRRSGWAQPLHWFPRMNSKWVRLLMSFAAGATNTYVYGVVNRNAPGARVLMPWTLIDQWVPFVPSAVWVYLSVHVLVIGAFLSLDGVPRARRYTTAYLLTLFVGVTVHWFLPAELPRDAWPVLGDTLSNQVLIKLRELDTPMSCWPSMHVAFSWLAALALWKSGKKRFVGAAVWAFAVSASTMLTKQHYLVDVVGGLVLAVVAWWALMVMPEGARTGRAQVLASAAHRAPGAA